MFISIMITSLLTCSTTKRPTSTTAKHRNTGVLKDKAIIVARAFASWNNSIKGITLSWSSTVSGSFENRLIILPFGVVSKNDMGHLNTVVSSVSYSVLEARIIPQSAPNDNIHAPTTGKRFDTSIQSSKRMWQTCTLNQNFPYVLLFSH